MVGVACEGCDFTNAKLVGVNFGGAMVRFAHFKGADLGKADFSTTDVMNANFEGALNLPQSAKDAIIRYFVAK